MRRAVHMWETAEYWQQRAAGALRHAKYKERPAVRARRIKRIEADLRKAERNRAQAVAALAAWSATPMPIEKARRVANYYSFPCVEREGTWGAWSAWDVLQPDGERYSACPSMTIDQVQQLARQHYPWTSMIARPRDRSCLSCLSTVVPAHGRSTMSLLHRTGFAG